MNSFKTVKILPKIIYGLIAATTVTTVTIVINNIFEKNESPILAYSYNDVFFEDFNGDSLDSNKWLIAAKSWGGNNGGVIPENVSVSNGTLKLEGHGNKYSGDIKGINQSTGVRTGAAIATREYFGSGSYEIVAKIAPEYGACSAMWTFEYEEYYPEDPEYKALGGKGSYYAVNHEIDIEMPGRASNGADANFEYALLNTFVTETKYTTKYQKLDYPQNDGNYHTYRFDWHTGSDIEKPRVEYYIDGKLYHTTYTTIPTNKGRFWIGLWFPTTKDSDGDGIKDSGWAGLPDFDTTVFEIDSVKITPFHESGDTKEKETYGKDGWAVDSFPEDILKENYNHIINGDFKNGIESWNLSGDAKVFNEEAILTSGSKTDIISQNVNVLPNMTYHLCADVKTAGTNVTLGIKKLNGTNDFSKTVSESGHVCLNYVTPTKASELKAYIEVLRYQETNQNVVVDNIVLKSGKFDESMENNNEDIEKTPDEENNQIDESNTLIKNGDFSNFGAEWTISGGTTFDGDSAILSSGNNTDTISQNIKVKKSQNYILVADVKTTGAEITIGIRDYNGRYTKKSETINKTGQIKIEFQTANHIELISFFAEVLRYQVNKDNVYIDNIKLIEVNNTEEEIISSEPIIPEETNTSNNLIKDGNFNLNNVWTLIGSAKIENGHAILASGNDTDIISQIVTVKPNTKYRLKANIISSGTTVDLYISDYNGKYSKLIKSFQNTTTGTLEFITGSDVKEIKIHARVLRYQSNTNNCFIDNMVLEEI